MNKSDNLKDLKYNDKIEDEKTYETIHCIIENWPDWKKEEYNANFAVSEYTERLVVGSR